MPEMLFRRWERPMPVRINAERPHNRWLGALCLCMCSSALVLTPARADAIDGDWCYTTQNLNIQGPKIRIPSGVEIQGDYSRHSFQYTVPANETGGGTVIAMQLMGEEVMQLTRTGGAPEVWRRCKPVS
jgi:hypothetical protein